MSKELDSLERIENFQVVTDSEKDEVSTIKELLPNSCKTLETALKDYQLHKEILNDYGFTLTNFREACLVLAQFRGIGFTGMENKLKALEIIKEKRVDVAYLIISKSRDDYNSQCTAKYYKNKYLSQEEYDLLREVLCYEKEN